LYADSTFLNEKKKMVYARIVPENKEIGYDLTICYNFAEKLFVKGQINQINSPKESPAYTVGFPPVFFYFLYPLFAFGLSSYVAFRIIYLLTLASFFILALILPILYLKRFTIPGLLGAILVTGLMSYGMQFEIERGQFNLISICLAVVAVFLFWKYPKLRWAAYILITLAIQFKLYPVVFLVMMVENWRDWKKNLLRLGILAGVNIGLLFSMGYYTFFKFIGSLGHQLDTKGYVRDHSINNFVDFLPAGLATDLSPQFLLTLKIIFYIIVVGIFLWMLYQYFKTNPMGEFNPAILMACLCMVLLAVPTSKDYRLSGLIGVVGIYLLYLDAKVKDLIGLKAYLLMGVYLLFSAAYSVTLISYAYRDGIFQNSFPFVLLLMVCLPIFEFLHTTKRHPKKQADAQLMSL
jgi:hypothetical protein